MVKQRLLNTALRILALSAMLLGSACSKPSADNTDDDNTGGNGGQTEFENDLFRVTFKKITATGASIIIYPSDKSTSFYYYYNIFEREDIDRTFYGDEESYFTAYLTYLGTQFGPNETWRNYLVTGNNAYDTDVDRYLRSGTEYVLLLAGVDFEGFTTTEVVSVPFTTAQVEPSGMTFDIEAFNGYIAIRPSANDPYLYFIDAEPDKSEKMTDAEIVAMVEQVFGSDIRDYIYRGEFEQDFSGILDDGDYCLHVFGYDGGATTRVWRTDFKVSGREAYTTLTGDHDFTDGEKMNIQCWRDYWTEYNVTEWKVEVRSSAGEFFITSLYTAPDAETPSGTYEIIKDWRYAPGFAGGGQTIVGYLFGTWWGRGDGTTNSSAYAAADSGTITFGTEGSDCTLDAVFADPQGHTVTVRYKGPANFSDGVPPTDD